MGSSPAEHPKFVAVTVKAFIESISANPDDMLPVVRVIAKARQKRTK